VKDDRKNDPDSRLANDPPGGMTTRQELEAAISAARSNLKRAKEALYEWEALAENNRYNDLETAGAEIEERLREQAFKDCQGAHNCGQGCYTQEFMVGEALYRGTLTCEYNRHDKMYYYIDSSEFTCECLTPSTN